MANTDQLLCTVTGAPGNTGYNATCYLDITQMKWAALVPTDLVIAKANLTAAAIIPYLKTLALNDDASVRLYPINDLILETAGGGDNRQYTDPYGGVSIVGSNPYQWLFQFRKGGAYLLSQLRKFNSNGQWSIILADDHNIYMADNGDGTASGLNLLSNWGNALQPPTGQDPTLYRFFISMTVDQLNDSRFALGYQGSISSLKGLQNINLTLAADGTAGWNEATGVANVSVKAGGINLYSRYKTALAAPAVWKAYNAATGGAITVSSVVANDGLLAFTVTLLTTDPDFPAGAQGITLTLVGPTELNTANIVGYEAATLLLPTTP